MCAPALWIERTHIAGDDDEFDDATLAEIAEFARHAETMRVQGRPRVHSVREGVERARRATASPEGEPIQWLAETFQADRTPLIRTDFSDDRAWSLVAADVTRPRHFEGSPYGPYEPQVTVFEDRFFEGATGESLAAMCAARQDVRGYAVLADARSLAEAASGAGITVS